MNIPPKHAAVAKELSAIGTLSPEERRLAHHKQKMSNDTDAQENSAISQRLNQALGRQGRGREARAGLANGGMLDVAGASPTAVLVNLKGSDRNKAAVRQLHDQLFEHARTTVIARRRDNSGVELNKVLKAVLKSYKDDPKLLNQRASKGVPSVMVPTIDDVIQLLGDERIEVAGQFDGGDYQEHMAKQMQWLIQELGQAKENSETWEEQYKMLLIEYATAEDAMNTAISKQAEAEDYLKESVQTLALERHNNRTMNVELNQQIAKLREKLYATLESQAGMGSTPASSPSMRLPPVKRKGKDKDKSAVSPTADKSGKTPKFDKLDPKAVLFGGANQSAVSATSPAPSAGGGVSFEEKESLLRQIVTLRQERDEVKHNYSVLEDKVLVAQQETLEQEKVTEETRIAGDREASNLKKIVVEMRDAHVVQLQKLEEENVKANQQIRVYERSIQDLQQQLKESAVRMLSLQNMMLSGPSVQTLLFEAVSSDLAEDAKESIDELTNRINDFAGKFDEMQASQLSTVMDETKANMIAEEESHVAPPATVESANLSNAVGSPVSVLKAKKSARKLKKAIKALPAPITEDASTMTDPVHVPAHDTPIASTLHSEGGSSAGEPSTPLRLDSAATLVTSPSGVQLVEHAEQESHAAAPIPDHGPAAKPLGIAPTPTSLDAAALMNQELDQMAMTATTESDCATPLATSAAALETSASTIKSRSTPKATKSGKSLKTPAKASTPSKAGAATGSVTKSAAKQSKSTPKAPAPKPQEQAHAAPPHTTTPDATSSSPTAEHTAEIARLQSMLERERRQHALMNDSVAYQSTTADFEQLDKQKELRAEVAKLKEELTSALEKSDQLNVEARAAKAKVAQLEGEKANGSDKVQLERMKKQLNTEKEKAMKATEKYNKQFLATALVEDDLRKSQQAHQEEVDGLHQVLVELRHEVQQLSKAEQRMHFINKEKNFSETCERAIRCIMSAQATLACPACLEGLKNPVVLFPCGHVVCETCFLKQQAQRKLTMPQEAEAAALQLAAHHAKVQHYKRHVSISGPKPTLGDGRLIKSVSVKAISGNPLYCEECDACNVVGFSHEQQLGEVNSKFNYLLSCVSEFKDVMLQNLAEDTNEALRAADSSAGRIVARKSLTVTLGDTSAQSAPVKGAAVDLERPPEEFDD